MPYGYGGGKSSSSSSSGPGPGGQGARGQATQNPGRDPSPRRDPDPVTTGGESPFAYTKPPVYPTSDDPDETWADVVDIPEKKETSWIRKKINQHNAWRRKKWMERAWSRQSNGETVVFDRRATVLFCPAMSK